MSGRGLVQNKVWRSEPQHLFAAELSTPALVAVVRNWIEKCTGNLQSDKNFVEYVADGIVLCELIQRLAPGIIRKINKIRSPFAWRENISFFLSACSQLGLSQSHLFSPDDLISTTSSSISNIHRAKGNSPGSNQSVRQICVTICYLALELASRSDYAGPSIQLEQQILPLLQSLPDRKNSAPLPGLPSPTSPESVTRSSSSCSSTVQSPSGRRTRRVESVTHLITETSCTDIQSYAELVLYLNGSSKEYTTIAQPGSIRLTQSFNRPYNSRNSRVHRTLSDRTPFLTKPSHNILQDSVSDNDIHSSALQFQYSSVFKEETGPNSWEKFEEYPEHSTATPSDASTVICREVTSSRCSSSLQTTGEDHSSSGDKEHISEVSVFHPSACQDIAREVEDLQQATPITSESTLESDVSHILSVDLNKSAAVKVPAENTGIEVGSIASPETGKSSIRRSSKAAASPDSSKSLRKRSSEVKSSQSISPGSRTLTFDNPVNNCTHQPHPVNPQAYPTFAEQVTDIHNRGRISSELNFSPLKSCATSDKASQRTMDNYVHAQHGNGHVSSTNQPVSLNGIKTRGYPSNCQVKDISVPSNGVPHHSLSLTGSDPDSPSCQVMYNSNGTSEGQSSNFNLAPLINPKHHNFSHLGSLDISRVQSDALPQSSLPSMVICGGSPGPSGGNPPGHDGDHRVSRFMADARSIDTNSIEDVEGFTIDDRKSTTSKGSLNRKLVDEVEGGYRNGGVAHVNHTHQSQHGRPNSAPQRSSSASAVSQHSTHSGSALVSPSHSTGSNGQTGSMEKRKSLDMERQKRKVNIQESTRVAMAYSTHFRPGSNPGSLPRNARGQSSTHSTGSGVSDDGEPILTTPPVTTPTHSVNTHVSSSTTPGGGPSSASPLNLHSLSMEQTKQASVNQMFEIWKEVEESETSKGSDLFHARSPILPTHSPILPTHVPEPEQYEVEVDSKTSEEYTVSRPAGELVQRQVSEVLQVADVSISLVDPVGQSTPLPTPQDTSSQSLQTSNSLLRPPLLTSPTGAMDSGMKHRNRPTSFSNKHIDSLLDTLKSLSRQDEDEDLKMLEDMLKSNSFQEAKHVHDDIINLLSGSLQPVMRRIVPNTQMMREHLHHHTQPSPEVEELRELLRNPDVQSVLFCHDKVSTFDLYVPEAQFYRTAHDPVDIIISPSIDNFHAMSTPQRHAVSSRDVPSNRKEGATIVLLERTNRPLGCTIYKQGDAVFIGRLLKGCDAEASDKLCEGDELLEVNGIPVAGMRTEDIIHLMSGDVASGSILSFTIIPVHDDSYDVAYEPKFMRAHFSYDGGHDDEVPCRALALVLHKEDILEIVQQEDPNWWQACKVFEEGGMSLPGLVPSMHLQQQREAMIRSYPYSSSEPPKKGLRGLFSKKKKKKIYYQNTPPSNILGVGDEIPTYEEVVRLDPDPSLCRPIVLVGAPGVGRKALIRKLVNSDPSLYQPVLRYAIHGLKPADVKCREFVYVTREEFERDIEQDRFLEYGEVKGHFYGTAFSAIKQVMESSCVPVLDVHPQALKKLRHSGLKPYVIFVASPRLERLQATRKVGPEKGKRRSSSLSADDNTPIYTEVELQQIVKESYQIESQYGHYFDWIIVNDDFQVATDMLKEVTKRLEYEPQWVPSAWKNY